MEASCTTLHGQQPVFFTGNQMHRNMPEVNIIFKQIKNSPSAGIRQFNIECNSNRDYIYLQDQTHHRKLVATTTFRSISCAFSIMIFAKRISSSTTNTTLSVAHNVIPVIPDFINDLIHALPGLWFQEL